MLTAVSLASERVGREGVGTRNPKDLLDVSNTAVRTKCSM
jgi:hypothetical protein